MAWMFQERLLSPALSSIGNGGEGVGTAFRRFRSALGLFMASLLPVNL